MRAVAWVILLWAVALDARADEARVRAHAAAFVAAFNAGTEQAAAGFVRDHAAPGADAARLREFFERYRPEGGLERAQVRVSASGRHAFIIARRTVSGAWQNFQFEIDAAHEDRLRLFFVAQALEPYELPSFGVADARFGAWLDGFVANLRQTQPFYGVIAVTQGERTLYERAFGLADVSEAAPNTVTTRFNTASGGKMFTAVAIMQLAERGELRLDDAFVRYVPEAETLPGAREITIRHLLTHTSGIPDYWDDAYERAWSSITEHEQMLAHVLRNFGAPRAGAYAYSNSNYALLGLIVERVSGENYYQYVHRHIFEPAGMGRTGYPLRSEAGAGDARPYNPVMDAGLVAIGRHEPAVLGARGSGAGGASTTLADMSAFDRALRGGVLVSPQTLAEMRALSAPSDVPGHGYGYGFIVNDGESYGHEGSAPGTQFAFRRYDAADVTIVVMSNFNTIAGPEIAGALDRILTR